MFMQLNFIDYLLKRITKYILLPLILLIKLYSIGKLWSTSEKVPTVVKW